MTLDRFVLLRNVGQFDNATPNVQLGLSPFSLIYAENGRGKTTLASILRSLATGDPSLITERQRLGGQATPHVVVSCQGNQLIFQNGNWNAAGPDIAIFDDAFVSANVCSGIEVETSHRQNLHELILGAQGVTLNAELQRHIARIEQHNLDLRVKGDAIPAESRGDLTPNAFCALRADPNIDTKLQEAERRMSAAKAADAIRQRDGFLPFGLPTFDIASINRVLGRNLASLEADAAAKVRSHLARIGAGGEKWVADGISRIAGASEGSATENCPFCAQDLSGSALIRHYQAYFSQAYIDLQQEIRDEGVGVKTAHSGDIPAAFERSVRTAGQARSFWKDFLTIPEIEVDTAAISRDWTAAREAVLDVLRAKAKSPLEAMTLPADALESMSRFEARVAEISELSGHLIACNAQIDIVKEQAAAADLAALTTDLKRLRAVHQRFLPAIAALCTEYVREKEAKSATELLRDQARGALDNYRQNIFPAYENAINDYLARFNAGFRLGAVASINTRAGSSAVYSIVINQQPVGLSAENGPSFRNTLSAGDRNTLALAFFFASLDQDPNLAQKIAVIDDPMTSLDEHRSLTTVQEMRRLHARIQQMIVLSHSKSFLCALWEGADRNARTAMRIVRAAAGSDIVAWDVTADCITEHDRRHALVSGYIQAANPAMERQVASALRQILEAFVRVAYPGDFPPGSMLGHIITKSRQRIGSNNEILNQQNTDELRALLDYANRFHHDTNPAWQTAVINDHELLGFSVRTLRFASRQ
jgi:wobble nucleotide-excising tRNase